MIGKKILNRTPISLAEVKEIIEKKKKSGELSYEQNLTLEYCKKFSKLKKGEALKLIGELEGLEKVSRENAIALANVLPKNPEGVRLFFSKEHFVLSEEEVKNILDILDNYRK